MHFLSHMWRPALLMFVLVLCFDAANAQEYWFPDSPKRARYWKGLVLPTPVVANVSVGFEQFLAPKSSLQFTGGAAGYIAPIAHGRVYTYVGYRRYAKAVEHDLEERNTRTYAMLSTGYTRHQHVVYEEDPETALHASAHLGLSVGAMVFSGRNYAVDVGIGVRGHYGDRYANRSWRQRDTWFSPMYNVQVCFPIH